MHHALRRPLTACLPRTTCASSARLQRRALVRVPPTSGTPTFPLDPRVRKGDKVIVAMSGGVDSSVVLRLLAEHDLDLSAVFMRNWSAGSDDELKGCEWERDWEDVRRVCAHVGGVPVEMVDLSREYWLQVFEPALDQWAQGVTPNPDVACNREIKFGALFSRLALLPSSPSSPPARPTFLATGHYAQVLPSANGDGSVELHACPDPVKDQSYFLSAVNSSALERTLFPLGHLHKAEVKALARAFDLPTAGRKESMGICFVENKKGGGKGAFPNQFLSKYIPPSPGPVLTSLGVLFEAHHGLHSYTVGQKFRKSGLKEGERWFVAAKDRKANALVVVEGASNPLLQSQSFTTTAWDWVARSPPAALTTAAGLAADVKIMSAAPRLPAVLRALPDGSVQVTYVSPPGEILTPGQTCAAYVGPRCLGSGTIAERAWEWPEGAAVPSEGAAVPSDADAAGAEADGGGKGGG